jgi:hypothetical protein
MTTEQKCHLVDLSFCCHQMMQASAIGEGDLRIASRDAKISKVKPLKSLACRTWKSNVPLITIGVLVAIGEASRNQYLCDA